MNASVETSSKNTSEALLSFIPFVNICMFRLVYLFMQKICMMHIFFFIKYEYNAVNINNVCTLVRGTLHKLRMSL
uniref:Uncharacterized protein n=1 Tax=Arundo donax TaxID=35708 RepID=A0A0A9HX33_ARUDO